MVTYKIIFIFLFLIGALDRIISTFKRRESEGEIKYRWTTYLLMGSYLSCMLFILSSFIAKETINPWVSAIGILTVGIGIFLRKSSIKALGNFWSIHIKVFKNQPIIKSGPYKFIRNPYYLAVMLELIGVSFAFNSFSILWFIILVHFPFLLLRTFLEEKTLLEHLGVEYQRYKATVNDFFPLLRRGV